MIVVGGMSCGTKGREGFSSGFGGCEVAGLISRSASGGSFLSPAMLQVFLSCSAKDSGTRKFQSSGTKKGERAIVNQAERPDLILVLPNQPAKVDFPAVSLHNLLVL